MVTKIKWFYKRTLETLKYEGIRIFLWRGLEKLISPFIFIGVETLYCKDLANEPIVYVKPNADIVINNGTEADIDQLEKLVEMRYGPVNKRGPYEELGIRVTLQERFRKGYKCFVARAGDEIVHYNWIAFNWLETIAGTGRYIVLKKDEACTNDAFTIEHMRGKGIHPAMNSAMHDFLKKAGYRKVYTLIDTVNLVSRRGVERSGWNKMGTILYFRIRGFRKVWMFKIEGYARPFLVKGIPPEFRSQ